MGRYSQQLRIGKHVAQLHGTQVVRRTHGLGACGQAQVFGAGLELLDKQRAHAQGRELCKELRIGRVQQPVLQFIGEHLQGTELEKRRQRIIGYIGDQPIAGMQQQGIRGKNHYPVDRRVQDRQRAEHQRLAIQLHPGGMDGAFGPGQRGKDCRVGGLADFFLQEGDMGVDRHVMGFQAAQVGLGSQVRRPRRTRRVNTQRMLQVLLVLEPQIQPAAQRGKVMGPERADMIRLPAQANLALRVETVFMGLPGRKILQGSPQQGLGFVTHQVVPNGAQQGVVGNQVNMHHCQVIVVDIE